MCERIVFLTGFSSNSASSATLVRLRYLLNYNTPDNYLYGIAGIALWSMIESGLGLIAGSLATLRPLLVRIFPFLNSHGSSGKTASGPAGMGGYRGGGGGPGGVRQSYRLNTMRGGAKHPTVTDTICEAGEAEWERISDNESQKDILGKGGITVTRDVTQTSSDQC